MSQKTIALTLSLLHFRVFGLTSELRINCIVGDLEIIQNKVHSVSCSERKYGVKVADLDSLGTITCKVQVSR